MGGSASVGGKNAASCFEVNSVFKFSVCIFLCFSFSFFFNLLFSMYWF